METAAYIVDLLLSIIGGAVTLVVAGLALATLQDANARLLALLPIGAAGGDEAQSLTSRRRAIIGCASKTRSIRAVVHSS